MNGCSDTPKDMSDPSGINMDQVDFDSPLDEEIDSVYVTIYFDFDNSDLKQEERIKVKEIYSVLEINKITSITIEGHTDQRGTREYNLALGERRATACRDYLLSLGYDSDKIEVKSYGEERPVVPESTEEAWSKNRRAEITINF